MSNEHFLQIILWLFINVSHCFTVSTISFIEMMSLTFDPFIQLSNSGTHGRLVLLSFILSSQKNHPLIRNPFHYCKPLGSFHWFPPIFFLSCFPGLVSSCPVTHTWHQFTRWGTTLTDLFYADQKVSTQDSIQHAWYWMMAPLFLYGSLSQEE